ncbi:MAG: hypothetical protein AMJ62_07115 [Myxococcales bacterium SG8_38]|nr:MAG: hypothetical protein AMJ62_07115 [Myxococcales bacterium SG8_38]
MKRTWLIFVSAFLISACSDSNEGTGDITYPLLDCDPLVPEFCGYPFPSNVYAVEDPSTPTGRRVSFGTEFMLGNDPAPWAKSDGFSAGSPLMTFLPGIALGQFAGPDDIDASLAEDSPSIVLDTETGELVPHFAEIDIRASSAEQRSTMIRPVVRLRDNARYVVAFRNLRNEDGDIIEPSPAFAALRDGMSSEDESVEARRDLYADIFKRLSDAGWAREDVQIAWDFTTASDQNNTQWLVHMRDTAFQIIDDRGGFEVTIDSAETSADPGAIDPTNIAFRILGTFRAPNFMTSTEAGSLLVFGEDGLPAVNQDTPWMDVPFEVLIPNSATSEDPAAIIEYGHGLLGSKSQIESGHFRSFMNEYNYAFCGTDLIGMSSSDYDTIVQTLFEGDISGLQTMFDRLHQGFLNYVLLLRMMKTSFANDENYGQYIKGDEAYYYGISQGGIMGSVVLATSPDVERGALGVMGQPYSFLLFRSVDFSPFLDIIKAKYGDFRAQQFLVALFQMLWDRVEPNGYTHHIRENPLPGTNTKEVLTRVAIGDHQVTTYAGHLMARTLKVPHLTTGLRSIWGLTPVESTESGSFYTEYDFGLPGQPPCNIPQWLCDDPHEWPRRREAARKQLDEFLRNGTGTNHCAPGDGDEHQAVAEGVCSYPSLSGCTMGETEDDTQALCVPGARPPQE